ncbi:MAG: hypothetical protein ACO1RX_20300 [Candidatus Sericytochromatia bacterium]
MILRYLDTHAEHRHLWHELDPRFQPVADARQTPAAYEAAVQRWFDELLPHYQAQEPLLLVLHLNEERSSDGRPWRIARQHWESWPARERIFVLWVSGGSPEVAQQVCQATGLPPSHAHFLDVPLAADMAHLARRWQPFVQQLALEGQARWELLSSTAERPSASLQRAWRAWRHDLLHALQRWPQRQAAFDRLLNAPPERLGSVLTPELQSRLRYLRSQHDLPALERLIQQLGRQLSAGAPEQSLRPEQPRVTRLLAHWQALETARKHSLSLSPPDNTDADLQNRYTDWRSVLTHSLDTLADVQALAIQTRQLCSKLAQNAPHSPLRQALHNGLEQHLYYVAQASSWLETAGWPLSVSQAQLNAWLPSLPLPEPTSPRTQTFPHALYQRLQVLIVEDHTLWCTQMTEHVQASIAEQGLSTRVELLTPCSSLADAQTALTHTDPEAGLLVLLDLSLPPTSGAPAARATGEALLEALSRYGQRAAVVVLTTPAWLLEDWRRLQTHGLADADLLLKSSAEHLPEVIGHWLTRLLQQPAVHDLQLLRRDEADSGEAWLNGFALDLPRGSFQWLYVLAKLTQERSPQRVFSAQQLLEALRDNFDTAVLPPSLQEALMPGSAEAQVAERLKTALAAISHALQGTAFDTQFWLNRLLSQARVLIDNPDAPLWPFCYEHAELLDQLCRQLENTQGLSLPRQREARWRQLLSADTPRQKAQRSLNSHVSDQIYRLRNAIHQSLKQAQRPPLSDEILRYLPEGHPACGGSAGGYALGAGVGLQWEQPLAPPARSHPVRALLLENDPAFVEELTALLAPYGLDLRVCQHLEALQTCLQDWQPELVLLDLHVPLTAAEHALNPLAGSETAGLQALGHIQARTGDSVQTVVLSVFSDDDDLRALARRLNGLENLNFVSKGGSQTWESELHLQIQSLLRRIQHPARYDMQLQTLPPLNVRVKAVSPELVLEVNGRPSVFRHMRARWMSLLLRHAGSWVSREQVLTEVYGNFDKPNFDEASKQQIKYLREQIFSEWCPQVARELVRDGVLETQRYRGARLRISQLQDPQDLLASVLTPSDEDGLSS